MSDEKKTTTPKPIAVREIKLVRPTDVPGKNMTSGLTSKAEKNRSHHTIEYHPWMRHFQITHHMPQKDDVVGYVHETCVASWIPA